MSCLHIELTVAGLGLSLLLAPLLVRQALEVRFSFWLGRFLTIGSYDIQKSSIFGGWKMATRSDDYWNVETKSSLLIKYLSGFRLSLVWKLHSSDFVRSWIDSFSIVSSRNMLLANQEYRTLVIVVVVGESIFHKYAGEMQESSWVSSKILKLVSDLTTLKI